MRFYDQKFFSGDESDDHPVCDVYESSERWKVWLEIIDKKAQSKIIFFMNEVQFLGFCNSVISAKEKYLRGKKEGL